MTGKDRKEFSETVDFAVEKGLLFCVIFNPAFGHYYAQFKTPDTQEEMGSAMGPDLHDVMITLRQTGQRVLDLHGLTKYEFNEKKPLIVAP